MTPEEIIARSTGALSLRRRVGYVALTLVSFGMAGLIALLWATEPALPRRTALAFAALVVIGLGWTGYGLWALTRRTPLFALDRVVAGWLSLAAWVGFGVGAMVIAASRDGVSWVLVALLVALGVVAVANLVRARAHRAALLRRRRELGGQ